MPRLSLWRDTKQNDYNYIDKIVAEQLVTGGTSILIHKYLGPAINPNPDDATQPQYDSLDPTNIQDLLFLENRDRVYDHNIYRLRGAYNVQNIDFDLSQFGLFLNNDVIFIVVHYNTMLDIIGRKLMVGDVLELPHLIDYDPLDTSLTTSLKRFYQITDANFASEGFSQTWYPHLWRIKCEPLVDTQEFSQILDQPTNTDNYLGPWVPGRTYPEGYVITFGGNNYTAIKEVPEGISPPNEEYWQLNPEQDIRDILSQYNQNIMVNDAALEEARRILPEAGYDTSEFYIVPTYGPDFGEMTDKFRQPAPPYDIITSRGAPQIVGSVVTMHDPKYKNPSHGVVIPKSSVAQLNELMPDYAEKLQSFIKICLQTAEQMPEQTEGGSGSVEMTQFLTVQSMGPVTGPFGTADNTYATSDQNPDASGFTGEITDDMNYLADCDPRYAYIARSSPLGFGYTSGYLTGNGTAPNGYPCGAGISFPSNPAVGDYFLRIDYLPQILYRWTGTSWRRISEKVRTETGLTFGDKSQLSGFINNRDIIYLNNKQENYASKQPLSNMFSLKPDNLPPDE